MILKRTDSAGNIIKPGDICIHYDRDKLRYLVYKGSAWGGPSSEGLFGRFITEDGETSVKYTSVLFAFDKMSDRLPDVKSILKRYYEEK